LSGENRIVTMTAHRIAPENGAISHRNPTVAAATNPI
jgi:hypothetical protein